MTFEEPGINKFMKVLESKDGKLFQKFYSRSSAGQQNMKDELQKLLSSILTLYQKIIHAGNLKRSIEKLLFALAIKMCYILLS